jgi:cold-inducible RNA-binding protein
VDFQWGGAFVGGSKPDARERLCDYVRKYMKLYVGSLSISTSESALRDLFSAHGTVTDVHIVTDRASGRSRGFAFVTMGNRHEGRAAMNALEGHSIDGRNLTVNEARPKDNSGASNPFQRHRR